MMFAQFDTCECIRLLGGSVLYVWVVLRSLLIMFSVNDCVTRNILFVVIIWLMLHFHFLLMHCSQITVYFKLWVSKPIWCVNLVISCSAHIDFGIITPPKFWLWDILLSCCHLCINHCAGHFQFNMTEKAHDSSGAMWAFWSSDCFPALQYGCKRWTLLISWNVVFHRVRITYGAHHVQSQIKKKLYPKYMQCI